MKKIWLPLTEDQKNRGIIFSSTLSNSKTEQEDDVIHEVHKDRMGASKMIERLLDDKDFNKSPWRYNIIRN